MQLHCILLNHQSSLSLSYLRGDSHTANFLFSAVTLGEFTTTVLSHSSHKVCLSNSLWIFLKYQWFWTTLHIYNILIQSRLCHSHLDSKKKNFLSNRMESRMMELNTSWNLRPLQLTPWEYCHRCVTCHGCDWNKMLKIFTVHQVRYACRRGLG